jgi:TPR repeat protein
MPSQGRHHPDLGYSRSSARPAGVARRLLLLLWFAMTLVPEARAADLLTEAVRSYAPVGYPRSAGGVLARAEQGDPLAQTYLGVMYLRGKGVPQNFEAAAWWLHRAAEADVPAAQYFLGLLYDKGHGVVRDFVLAQAWLNLAVAHAEPAWRSRWALIRDAVASKMSRDDLAEAQRLALDWRPASAR